MKVSFNPKFKKGQIVYLRTDPDQLPRMVTRYLVGQSILYEVSLGEQLSYHSDYEISEQAFLQNGLDYS